MDVLTTLHWFLLDKLTNGWHGSYYGGLVVSCSCMFFQKNKNPSEFFFFWSYIDNYLERNLTC